MIGMEFISGTALLAFLGIGAFSDMRRQTIPIWLIIAGAAAGGIVKIFEHDADVIAILLSVIPGAFLLLFAFLTKEKIGYGDGWMIMVTGVFLGLLNNLILLVFALVIFTVYQLAMILAKKATKKSRAPFVPFILISFITFLAVS